jgi:hypothetical protein
MLRHYNREVYRDCSSLRESSGQAGQKSFVGFLVNNN